MTDKIKTLEQKQQRRQSAIGKAAKMLKLPSGSPERWRLAYENFLEQRPEAVEIDEQTKAYAAEKRALSDKFATSGEIGRMTMVSPPWLMPMLKLADPAYFINARPEDLISTRHLKKMLKAFPFYFIPEVV